MSNLAKQSSQMTDDLPIFIDWMKFMDWLVPVADKFPKVARFTFSQRLTNLGLDMVEDLVEARHSKRNSAILKRANLRLEKLRVILRLSHQQKYLSHKQYEFASKALYEIGKQLGGWSKQAHG